MELALQAALLGAVLGGAVLAAAALYGWTLPYAPGAYGWWALGFAIDTLGRAVLMQGPSAHTAELADLLHAASTLPALLGAQTLCGERPERRVIALWSLVCLAWVLLVHWARLRGWLAPDLPALGLGGVPLLLAAWRFHTGCSCEQAVQPNALGTFAFTGHGLVLLVTPLLPHDHALAAWALFAAQVFSVLMALALVLEVLHRQQARALTEGERAAQSQARLREVLDRTDDGVALFDGHERLVSANDRYLDFMAPLAGIIVPGLTLDELMSAESAQGVLRHECPIDSPRQSGERVSPSPRGDAAASSQGVEAELADGRWVSVHLYPTGDGGFIRLLRDVSARRQMTESLRDSISWLQGIMETVVDGIIAIDRAGLVVSFNGAASRIFGYSADEVLGRNVSMLMPQPFQREHDSYLRRHQETGEARIIGIGRQVRGLRKNGEEFPLELAVTQMQGDNKVTYIGLVRDITERKRVEDALVESEQRFRDLAESASDWFWELDRSLAFTFVSGRVRQVLGVGPDHFLGRHFSQLAGGCDNPLDWPVQKALMDAHRPFRGFIFRHLTGDGSTRFVEMAGRPVQDVAGAFAGYRGTATDITPLKRHEQELAAQSGLRQAIIDHMGQGVVVFDGEERLVALNRQARDLLHLPEAEIAAGASITLEGLLLFLALRAEFGEGAVASKVGRRLTRLRRSPHQVAEHVRPNGQVLEVRSTAMPGGGLIWTLTDITERKKTEATLREAKEAAERGNRAKATFLANISHELRTPLNAIIGFSELMKHEIFGPLEPVPYRAYVDDVHESGQHLLELINDILDMSKAEAGMTDLSESLVDIAALVRAALRLMERRAQTHDITLAAQLPDHLPWLLADERRIRQILLNLLSNAVKFTDDGGRVDVSVRIEQGEMMVVVSDTGIGMSAEDLERVMEPFVQADSRLSRKYEGTGLGLPLTRAMILAHGGTMTIASDLNQGTRVTVSFPPARVIADPAAVACLEEDLNRR